MTENHENYQKRKEEDFLNEENVKPEESHVNPSNIYVSEKASNRLHF